MIRLFSSDQKELEKRTRGHAETYVSTRPHLAGIYVKRQRDTVGIQKLWDDYIYTRQGIQYSVVVECIVIMLTKRLFVVKVVLLLGHASFFAPYRRQ